MDWPGNVRELAHRVEAAAIRASADASLRIEATHLGFEQPATKKDDGSSLTFHEGTRRYQRELLAATLESTDGNIAEAARRLDLTRGHVYTLITTLGLDRS
jgi:Nif-specific regulatory protein